MTTAWGKKLSTNVWHVFVLRLVIFLVFAFFMAIVFLMGVMNISYALPIGLYKSLWNSEIV